MAAILVVEDGPIKGREIPLKGKKILIGRGHDCDLQVLDERLSRVHCRIEKRDDSYFAASSNKNYVGINRSIERSDISFIRKNENAILRRFAS